MLNSTVFKLLKSECVICQKVEIINMKMTQPLKLLLKDCILFKILVDCGYNLVKALFKY